MTTVAWWVLVVCAAIPVYAYAAYPLLLWLAGPLARRRVPAADPPQWPMVTITIPAYNEELAIAATLERIVASDYPADRRQVLVVSDASTDGTNEIVRAFAPRGVELLVMPARRGKTAAENEAQKHLRGDIVVNTDASVAVHPGAIRALVRAFTDATVGLASSRDVSVANVADAVGAGESGYVSYEMWVRRLETRVYGIVGASGSLYAIRADLHRTLVPEALSRDFAAAMIARESGYRAVSVDEAICYVPRGRSLHREFHRKQRTMTRGLETLWYKRHLLNPFRYGVFALMLLSHKFVRWLAPVAAVVALAALAVLAASLGWARWALVGVGAFLALGLAGWLWPEERPLPRALAVPAYVGAGVLAALLSWYKALTGEMDPVWEPTRRSPVPLEPR
jgi:cellulose synthase/poly-beta-1,6-N-acetylglucosamine synthase-like glycosyltransferase